RGETEEEYYRCIDEVMAYDPEVVHDDGADLIIRIHEKRPELAEKVLVGCEETTTGVIRLKAMERDGVLRFPVIAVNDTRTKRLFDNVEGTGLSTMEGILKATGVLMAGKNVVVAGYGYCGSGIAKRARGLGANVVVCEVDPVKALQAVMEGYRVMPMDEAAAIGDIFITATGCKDIVTARHMLKMKDGAVLCNSGHFNVEVSVKDLEEISVERRRVRPYVDEYRLKDGRKLYLLGEGRLVNLVCGPGHPSEVMDLSFGNQALCARYVVRLSERLEAKVYSVPASIDRTIAELKLEAMGMRIDRLTPEQEAYLRSWRLGT
ncbi:TPA: adenosylhomocysteinase, partial [Candidatus Bathyarchaeota archaeon]|nr:adenosylhomocysteinase [Candidatus Bathyarchaeota archaeon]